MFAFRLPTEDAARSTKERLMTYKSENVWIRGYKIAAKEWSPLRVMLIVGIMSLLYFGATHAFLGINYLIKFAFIAFLGPIITRLVYRVTPKPSAPGT